MKFIDIIFCDDIRNEVNNKLSLMGVYNDRIIFHISNRDEVKWPLLFNLSAFIRIKANEKKYHPDRFEFEYLMNDKSIVKIEGTYKDNVKNQQIYNLAFVAKAIPLEPGHLGFSIKLYEKNKLLLSEKQNKVIKIMVQT